MREMLPSARGEDPAADLAEAKRAVEAVKIAEETARNLTNAEFHKIWQQQHELQEKATAARTLALLRTHEVRRLSPLRVKLLRLQANQLLARFRAVKGA